VPELDMHTISDQLVPVQHENYYRHTVAFAGRSPLLRQAFVRRQLHCNFQPSELVAGVLAVQHRVETGHWGSVANPNALEASAARLAAADPNLGSPAIIPYHPAPLSGNKRAIRPAQRRLTSVPLRARVIPGPGRTLGQSSPPTRPVRSGRAGRVAPSLLVGHLADHERTALELLAHQLQLRFACLLGALARRLRWLSAGS
jgi:hypothetical protein